MSGPVARTKFRSAEDRAAWGVRADGTQKGEGFLGILKRPEGGVSTEISVGVQIDGKEMQIPLIVPTLSAAEVKYLLNNDPKSPKFFKNMPQTIMRKAVSHAVGRMRQGQHPFMK